MVNALSNALLDAFDTMHQPRIAAMRIEKTLPPMTDAERQEFSRLDAVVGNVFSPSAVVDKGAAALLRIREGQLYRDAHETYDQ